jgi:hypothetical protein
MPNSMNEFGLVDQTLVSLGYCTSTFYLLYCHAMLHYAIQCRVMPPFMRWFHIENRRYQCYNQSQSHSNVYIELMTSVDMIRNLTWSTMVASALWSSNTATTESCPAPAAIIRAVKPNWKYSLSYTVLSDDVVWYHVISYQFMLRHIMWYTPSWWDDQQEYKITIRSTFRIHEQVMLTCFSSTSTASGELSPLAASSWNKL